MEAQDSTVDERAAESTQDNQATTSEDVVGDETAPTTSDLGETMEEAPHSSENGAQNHEAPTQDEAVASSESEFAEQREETVNQGICGL